MSDPNASGAVVVNARGPARANHLAYARRKIGSVLRFAPAPVGAAKVDLVVDEDPARERYAFVEAELDLDGTVVRAQAIAPTVAEAVDLLETRLGQQIQRALAKRPGI